ncbi:MAG: nucleotidyl transferase AbiEii/AbiGii toxin family protein [Planctomycetota bacterium]
MLTGFGRHPFLKSRLVLKGGTALNLFLFDLPRLSVDIDAWFLGCPLKTAADGDFGMAPQLGTAGCWSY